MTRGHDAARTLDAQSRCAPLCTAKGRGPALLNIVLLSAALGLAGPAAADPPTSQPLDAPSYSDHWVRVPPSQPTSLSHMSPAETNARHMPLPSWATDEAPFDTSPAAPPAAEAPTPGLFEAAVGGTAAPGTTASPASAGVSWDVGGYLRGGMYAGKTVGLSTAEIKTALAELALQPKINLKRWASAKADLRLAYAYQATAQGPRLDVREALIDLSFGAVDLRIGQQIIAWGRADALNPTDNVTPQDLRVRSASDDDRRLSNLALRARLTRSVLGAELIYVPLFRASYYPDMQPPKIVSFIAPSYPGLGLGNGTAAGKIDLRGDRFECSLSYLFGYATFPGVALIAMEADLDNPSATVQFRSYRHHVLGADFSTTLGEVLGLRGEVAYRHPTQWETTDLGVPLPELQYVLGADRELWGRLMIIAQYVGKFIFYWDMPAATGLEDIARGKTLPQWRVLEILEDPDTAGSQELTRQNLILANQSQQVIHGGLLRLSWAMLHETLKMEALGYYNFSTNELMARAKVSYALSDDVEATLGGDYYFGDLHTLFDWIDEEMSMLYFEVKAAF